MYYTKTLFGSIVFLFTLLAANSSFGQDTANTNNIAKYYKAVHNAEFEIIHNHLDSALALYQAAFQFKYPNGDDLFNACLAAYYIKDSVLAKHFVDMVAFNGKPKMAFADSITYPGFYIWLHKDYDSVYKAGILSNKYKMALPLKAMFKIDQELASDTNLHYQINNEFHDDDTNTTFKERITFDTLKNGLPNPDGIANFRKDSMNLVSLNNYIKKYGFPDFEKVGYWGSLGIGGFTIPGFILWHHRWAPTEIDHLFYKAVKEGKFPPEQWATINMDRPGYNVIKMGSKVKKSISYDPYHMCLWLRDKKLSHADSARINLIRKNIYLPSLNDYYKIWLVAKKLNDQMRTDYNPNVYGKGMSVTHQFNFLLGSLIPSDKMIELGVKP